MSETDVKETGTDEVFAQNPWIEDMIRLRNFEVQLEDGTRREAIIRLATQEEARQADEYAISVTAEKATGETNPITGRVTKLPLRANMMEHAKEKGMWTDDDDIKFATLEGQLTNKIERLVQGKMKQKEAYQLAIEICQHRKEMRTFTQRRWNIYNLTADAAGEEAGHRYVCVATAVWKDNQERIFRNIAEFESNAWIRNQVLDRYMEIMAHQNDITRPLETELGFFRDFGFMDNDGNIYDVNKKNIVFNMYETDMESDKVELFSGITDDDGNPIVPERHPSMAPKPTAESDGK
jgi:hypothetical protein